jgi:hypothetical protein
MFRSRDRARGLKSLLATVSQYAAYALALPFKTASTDGYWVGGTQYGLTAGPELITNGTFDTNTAGWTSVNPDGTTGIGTLSVVFGRLRITNGDATNLGGASQAITTAVGVRYRITLIANGSGNDGYLTAGNTPGYSQQYALATLFGTGPDSPVEMTFTATATTTYIAITNPGSGNGAYQDWDNVSVKRTLGVGQLPGYSYTRTGQVGFVNQAGGVDYFAANVPPVEPNIGYEAYGALTNNCAQSQDVASWTLGSATATANAIVAPDGTTTADLIVSTGGLAYAQLPALGAFLSFSAFIPAGGTATHAWLQSGAGATSGYFLFNRATGALGSLVVLTGAPVATATAVAVGTGWRVNVYTSTAGGNAIIGPSDGVDRSSVAGKSLPLWQGQLPDTGNFPDGGPIIVTTTAAVTVGASSLSAAVNPITVDQDFIFYVVGNATHNASATEILAHMSSASQGIRLLRSSAGALGVQNDAFGATIGATLTTGRYVALYRRRGGKDTVATKIGSTVAVGVETGLAAFPAAMNSTFGVGKDFAGGSEPGSPEEGVFVQTGTFSDAQLTTLLTGL